MENKTESATKKEIEGASEMFNFIKTMWFMRKATEFFVEEQARRGRITEAEKELILETLQIPKID